MNKLRSATCYLCGAMDRVDDGGVVAMGNATVTARMGNGGGGVDGGGGIGNAITRGGVVGGGVDGGGGIGNSSVSVGCRSCAVRGV